MRISNTFIFTSRLLKIECFDLIYTYAYNRETEELRVLLRIDRKSKFFDECMITKSQTTTFTIQRETTETRDRINILSLPPFPSEFTLVV